MIGEGHVTLGGCISLTETVNEQFTELLLASATEHVTVVTPLGKTEPEAGVQFGTPTPGQLSATVGAAYVTTAVQRFGSVL